MDENMNDERLTRYIEALAATPGAYAQDADYARSVMSVADAEQAELRSSREALIDHNRNLIAERRVLLDKVARIEALAERAGDLDNGILVWDLRDALTDPS